MNITTKRSLAQSGNLWLWIPVVVLILNAVNPAVHAQTFSAAGGIDPSTNQYDWSNPLNWSSDTVPTTGGDIVVAGLPASGGSPTVYMDSNYTSSNALNSLTLDTGSNFVQIFQNSAADSMYVSNTESIGTVSNSSPLYDQNAGTNTTSVLDIATNATSNAAYNLTGDQTVVLTAGSENLGNFNGGFASFEQGGGVNDVGTLTVVGSAPSQPGEYIFSGGAINADTEMVGTNLYADFFQIGGTNTTREFDLGLYGESIATYELTGDSTSSLNAEYETIGEFGSGTFTQSGGVNNIGTPLSQTSVNQLLIGVKQGGTGEYYLQGGTLNGGYEYVGYMDYQSSHASADFNQSGGTNNALELDLAEYKTPFQPSTDTSIGTYELSGDTTSTLNAGVEKIGVLGKGIFTQSGGINTVEDPFALTQTPGNQLIIGDQVGSFGQYNLQDGTLFGSYEIVGNNNSSANGDTADFNQTGGTNIATELDLAEQGNGIGGNYYSVGTYELSGDSTSVLTAGVEIIGVGGHATFTQTGGVNNVADPVAFAQDPTTLSQTSSNQFIIGSEIGSIAQYNLQGGTLNGAYEYIGYGNEANNGPGDIADFNQTSGTNNAIELHIGANPGTVGTYELGPAQINPGPDPVLNAGTESIGDEGTGTFTQSGGVNNAGAEYVGYYGNGTYTQTGGANNLGALPASVDQGVLTIGLVAGSHGEYYLEGGTLTCSNLESIGSQNSLANGDIADFNQSGGTNSAGPGLDVGDGHGGVGTYELSGDSTVILTSSQEYVGVEGNGTFTQSGGVNTVKDVFYGTVDSTNRFVVGDYQGSNGQYNLQGGTLNGAYEIIGNNQAPPDYTATSAESADFNQSGGTNNASIQLDVAELAGSEGTYELSGDFTSEAGPVVNLFAPTENIGVAGNGTFTQLGGVNTVGTLNVGAKEGSTGLYAMTNGLLNAGFEVIGENNSSGNHDTANFDQVGGVNIVDDQLVVGSSGGSVGIYTLGDPANVASPGLYGYAETIGHNGNGTFTQTGGTNYVVDATDPNNLTVGADNQLIVGDQSGSAGQYNLEGGVVFSGSLIVGNNNSLANHDMADFKQTGGDNQTYNLVLGASTGSVGTYELSGSNTSTMQADIEYIGLDGKGTLTQSGGVNTVEDPQALTQDSSNQLLLGDNADGSGIYNLQSGELSTDREAIGLNGNGKFAQTGGSNSVTEFMYVAYGTGSVGEYDLTAPGTLSAEDENVGRLGHGTFNQSNGTNTITDTLYVGSQAGSVGNFSLSGTGVLSAGTELIGNAGVGTFTQTAGSNTATTSLVLGQSAGAEGTYNLGDPNNVASPSLFAYTETIGESGNGTFTQTGGINYVVDATDPNHLTAGPDNQLIIGDQAGSSGHFNLQGGSTFGYAEIVGNSNSATNHDVADFKQTGGANSTEELSLGENTGSAGTYELSGDSSVTLTASVEYVGVGGQGTFTQNGGVNDIEDPFALTQSSSNDLVVGYSVGASGQYNLNSGTLTADAEAVAFDGTGTFVQSGGTNTITDQLEVGDDVDGVGQYTLKGSGVLTAFTEFVATGTFTQSGGSNTVSAHLNIGYNGHTGTYDLSGSGTLASPAEVIGQTGTGIFNQHGGTNKVDNLDIDAAGTYTFSGGALSGLTGTGTITNYGIFNVTNANLGSLETAMNITNKSGAQFNVDPSNAYMNVVDEQAGSKLTIDGGEFRAAQLDLESQSTTLAYDSALIITQELDLGSDISLTLDSATIYAEVLKLGASGNDFSVLSGVTWLDGAVIYYDRSDSQNGYLQGLTYTDNGELITPGVQVAPEPGTWGMILFGLATLVGYQHLRKRVQTS